MDRAQSSAKREAAWARIVGGLLLVACAACRSSGAAPTPPWRDEIEALNGEIAQLFRSGNLLGIADLYAADAAIVDQDDRRTSGREEIDAYWAAIESPVSLRLAARSIRGSPALAYEVGTRTLVVEEAGGIVIEEAEFLLLWRREPEGWRIVFDCHWVAPR
jgi:ketosteroid isomerase-like protein